MDEIQNKKISNDKISNSIDEYDIKKKQLNHII